MEYFEEGDLKAFMLDPDQGCFSQKTNQNIMKQLFQALKYLHETKHIDHRHLQMSSIMVDQYNADKDQMEIKLKDFGFATFPHANQGRMTTEMQIEDISTYAPEVIKGEAVTNKVDIWAAGVIAF